MLPAEKIEEREGVRFDPGLIAALHSYADTYANLFTQCFGAGCKRKPEYHIGGPVCAKHAIKKLTYCRCCGDVMKKMYDDGTPKDNRMDKWVCTKCIKTHYESCFNCGNLKKMDELLCPTCSRDDDAISEVTALDSIDRQMAMIVMEYYATMAQELEWGKKIQFKVTPEQVELMASYFATTVASELRHANQVANLYTNDYHCLRTIDEYHELIGEPGRNHVMASFIDWHPSVYDAMVFLRSAYAAFTCGTWRSAFGGPSWAYCCWRALLLLSELSNNRGIADNLTWEMCLNACHNNSRWLNKLGWHTYHVLVMGANATPKEILDIYYANDPILAVKRYAKPRTVIKEFNDFGSMPAVSEVWTEQFVEDYGDRPRREEPCGFDEDYDGDYSREPEYREEERRERRRKERR